MCKDCVLTLRDEAVLLACLRVEPDRDGTVVDERDFHVCTKHARRHRLIEAFRQPLNERREVWLRDVGSGSA